MLFLTSEHVYLIDRNETKGVLEKKIKFIHNFCISKLWLLSYTTKIDNLHFNTWFSVSPSYKLSLNLNNTVNIPITKVKFLSTQLILEYLF